MGLIRLAEFGGKIPVLGDRALPDTFATESINTWLYASELRGIHPATDLHAINNITRKVFRIPKGTVGGDPAYPLAVPPPSYLGDSVWMQFTDPDTDIVRGPLTNDSFKRFYWASPSTGAMFNTYARLLVGDPGYLLGVPSPPVAPGLVVTGGAASNVTRAYIYTWMNIYGEESGPSPPTVLAGHPDGSWDLTLLADPTTEFAGRGPFDKKRVYRTITAASGTTTYFRVAEVAAATTIYSDVITDPVLANNQQLETANYALPPLLLEGIIMMPNGYMVGFKGNELFFSEPYALHAWPAEYILATEYPIVGLGVFGSTCVVATQGFPETITGITPVSSSKTKVNVQEPCLSRGSILSTPDGVYYASQNGLMGFTAGGMQNLTQKLVTREDWIKDYTPDRLRAARYQQGYLALRAVPTIADRSAFFLDLTDMKVALTELSEFESAHNVHGDVFSGEVFVIQSDQVKRYDTPGTDYLPTLWKSKEFQLPFPLNLGCYQIEWDDDRFSNVNIATDILATTEKCQLKVWVDRVLQYNQYVPLNRKPCRLPSGFKGHLLQIEIRARVPVYSFAIASTIKELKGA